MSKRYFISKAFKRFILFQCSCDFMPSKFKILKKAEECEICGCKSKVEKSIGSAVGGGNFLICPAEQEYPELHAELAEKVENLSEGEKHPKSYLKELEKEIRQIRRKFKDTPVLEKVRTK